jgi:hypothetical protein
LRDVANALRCSQDIHVPDRCLACGVLRELTENFGEHCSLPGYDFFGNGFCVQEYSDAELESFLHVPFPLPKNLPPRDGSSRQTRARPNGAL